MRDDQRPDNPSDPGDRRDAFDDALDDLFGPDTTPDPEPAATVPPQPTVSPSSPPPAFDQESYRPQESGPPAISAPPLAPPPQRSTGPGIRGWTWRKAGCFTCLGFFGIIFACLVILFIIGLISGDPDDPGPSGQVWDVPIEVHDTFQDDHGGVLAEPFPPPDGRPSPDGRSLENDITSLPSRPYLYLWEAGIDVMFINAGQFTSPR